MKNNGRDDIVPATNTATWDTACRRSTYAEDDVVVIPAGVDQVWPAEATVAIAAVHPHVVAPVDSRHTDAVAGEVTVPIRRGYLPGTR